jgi:AcrR family transcriptional regulator
VPAPTRERILDAAWRLFLRQGFAGTTVTQIEAAASLAAGSGSFYRHFRSKEDVLRAAVDREVDRIDADRTIGPELSETGGDVRIALALEFQRRIDTLRRLHPLMVLVQRERDHLGPSREHLGERLVAHNLEVRSQRLAAWMSSGAIPDRDPEALAAAVMCALTGYYLSVEFFGAPPGAIGKEAFVTTLVDLVVGD